MGDAMNGKLVLGAALVAACVPVCHAADNPWNGTWKLNEAKSKMTGGTDTISKDASGKFTVASSGLTFSFGCDGAQYPLPGGRMLACTKTSDMALHLVITAGSDELAQMDRTLSDGGKTMTVVETGKAQDGTPFHDTVTYTKISAGSGDAWTGTWQNTKMEVTTHGVAVVEAKADSITFTYPMTKSTLTAKLDGTPAAEQGPHPEEGLLVSLTADGPLTIREVDTYSGTAVEHDVMSVTPDGKTMTVEVQRTGGTAKQVYVYDKQ